MSTSNRINEVIPADVLLEVTKKLNECKTQNAKCKYTKYKMQNYKNTKIQNTQKIIIIIYL